MKVTNVDKIERSFKLVFFIKSELTLDHYRLLEQKWRLRWNELALKLHSVPHRRKVTCLFISTGYIYTLVIVPMSSINSFQPLTFTIYTYAEISYLLG